MIGWIIITVILSMSAFALPATFEEVRVDDFVVLENQVNRLAFQRNAEHLVEIRFFPTQDIKNAELEIFVSGFEYKDLDPIRDSTGIFDADANVSYIKRLSFRLTDEVDEDDYKLRVIFTDRFGAETIKNFNLKFDVPRHSLNIEDVVFSPQGAIKAGGALLSTIRIENKGEKKENDLRVEVSIPQLHITGVDYIDEIRPTKEESTEEIFMKIPVCTAEGDYLVNVKILYNQLHDLEEASAHVRIMANPECSENNNTSAKVLVKLDGSQPVDTPIDITGSSHSNQAADSNQEAFFSLRKGLEIALIILVTLLVTLGVIVGISRMKT